MNDYFIWSDHSLIFEIPAFDLPFPISIYGIFAGLIIQYFATEQILKKQNQGKSSPEKSLPWFLGISLFLGSQLVAQLLFSLLSFPMVETFGPWGPRWYSMMFAVAFICGYYFGKKLFEDGGYDVALMEKALMYVIGGTIIGARLGHCLFYDPIYYLTNPVKILMVWEGGLASHGAAIGIPTSIWLFTRNQKAMSFMWLADRVSIPVAFGGIFVRLGNFFNSEIIGHPTDMPWAIIFSKVDMLPRHPSMLYEAAWCVLVFALLWSVYQRYSAKPPEGMLLGLTFSVLFAGRFFIEFTKTQQAHFDPGTLNMGQWLSIPVVLVGLWLVYRSVSGKTS